MSDALDVSIPQLRCFVTVVEVGSFADAGRQLGMSAASVSKGIARLEQSTKVRLLHRSTHSISLTPEGEALLEPARSVVAAALDFRASSNQAAAHADGGTIRISVSVGLSRAVLAPLIAKFCELHPDIGIEVRATNEIVSLVDQGVDLAIRSGSLSRIPGHIQQRWFSSRWVMCASAAYLGRAGIPETIEDLAQHVLLGFRNPRTGQVQSWSLRSQEGKSVRFEPTSMLVFDDGDSGWQAALAGAGICCTPLYLAAPALSDGRAIEVLTQYGDGKFDVSIIRQDRRRTPRRVSIFIDFLMGHPPLLPL
jgi:DNA-binding transcriptional LysR family regulator